MDFFTHPATVTFLFAAALIAMNVAAQWAIARLTPEEQKQWRAITLAVVLGVMSAVIAVPTINHLWAGHRDEQNEQRAQRRVKESERLQVRVKHLDRLRPLLRSDSKKLAELSRTITKEGNALRGVFVEDYEQTLDGSVWYPEVLARDLVAHFPDYARARDNARNEVFAQQRETLDLQRTTAAGLRGFARESSYPGRIAAALIQSCLGLGSMRLSIDSGGGYSYDDGIGGSRGGGGNPPPELLQAWEVYQAFKPTDSFRSSCTALKAVEKTRR